MDKMYTYYVNPWRPVIGLSIGVLNNKKIVKLYKEDVLKCLEQKARVFRRFNANDEMIKITEENVDRYHTESLLSDEEFKQLKVDEAAEGSKDAVVPEADPEPEKVEEPVVEEAKDEAPAPVVEETVEEEAVEEEPVVEDEPEEVEEVAEEAPAEEALNTETEVAEEEQIQEEAVAEETTSDASAEDDSMDKVILGFDDADNGNRKRNKKHHKNNNQ